MDEMISSGNKIMILAPDNKDQWQKLAPENWHNI